MEMDQISLQTLDRASIDIRRTLLHLSRSLGLLIPLLLRAKAHTLAHTKGHDSTLRLSFIPAAPSPPRLSHTSFLSTLCSRLTSASPPPLQNSPVTGRIHQVSAKYRNPLLSLSATFLLVSPYTFVPYVRNDHANGSILRMGERGMDGWISLRIQDEPKFFFFLSNRLIFSLFRSNCKKQGLSVIQKGTMKFPHLSKFPLIPPFGSGPRIFRFSPRPENYWVTKPRKPQFQDSTEWAIHLNAITRVGRVKRISVKD